MPEPSASDDRAAELTATTEPLEPGRWTRRAFTPAITIELDEGWRAVQLLDGFFDVQQQDPDEAVELLGANADLTVLETSESRIGGLTGAQVTVDNAGDAHAEVIDVPPGPLGIDPGRRLWIAFFETDDGLLAIMVGGSIERWDEALLTAEPVLESVRFGTRGDR